MREIIRLEPVFKQMVWGGSGLRDYFGYEIPGEDTGEAWVVSAHPQGDCRVAEGSFEGKTLSQLWKEERALFGGAEGEEFPLLVKFIDAKEDLSIQVHPDDHYAFRHEQGSLGKTECWYILDCDEDTDIIIGHHARIRQELEEMIGEGRWDDLLRKLPVYKGDFFYIPSGTVHAIRKGTLLLEVQQNSDTTYRLYDYGRLQNGKPRDLHLRQSMDVITCPCQDQTPSGPVIDHGAYETCTLVKGQYFTVDRWRIRKAAEIRQDHPFLLADVTSGSGALDGTAGRAGDHLLIPAGYGTVKAQGDLELITTYIS